MQFNRKWRKESAAREKEEGVQRGIRTDMANEALASMLTPTPGVRSHVDTPVEGIEVTRVDVLDARGAKSIGKAVGCYVTIDAPDLIEGEVEFQQSLIQVLARELASLIGPLGDRDTVLVVGLGNRDVTPDALGPGVVDRVLVSRHVTQYLPELVDEKVKSLCALAPGVLGVTGIETAEVIRGVLEHVKPKALVAIDALASRSTDRISTSIQLSDSGIHPGSGLGNRRMELSRETLGLPVIAVGIPTVVHASTISEDAVSLLLEEMGEKGEEDKLRALVARIMNERIGPLVVTPKEIDKIIQEASMLIAEAINLAVHDVELSELRKLLH